MQMQATAERLVEMGGREWQKGDHHRIYLNEDFLAKIVPHMIEKDGGSRWIGTHRVTRGIEGSLKALGTRYGGRVWYDVLKAEFATRDVHTTVADALIRILEQICEDPAFAEQVFGAAEDRAQEAEAPAQQETATPEPAPAVGSTVRTATGPGIQGRPVRTNRHAGTCIKCYGHVPAGQGHLYYIDPDEAYEHSGWVVEHKDEIICRATIEARRQELAPAKPRRVRADDLYADMKQAMAGPRINRGAIMRWAHARAAEDNRGIAYRQRLSFYLRQAWQIAKSSARSVA